jgi:hypothetical protein
MFPDEKAVLLKAEEQDVSFFLPESQVRSGMIEVELLDEDATGCTVALPRQAMEGPRVVKVSKDLVRAAR